MGDRTSSLLRPCRALSGFAGLYSVAFQGCHHTVTHIVAESRTGVLGPLIRRNKRVHGLIQAGVMWVHMQLNSELGDST